MKTIVFAYSNIGCAGIKSLVQHGFDIQAIITHPDNPDENLWFDSVAELAVSLGIPVYAPEDVNHPLWVETIREMNPDVIFSLYYRGLLSKDILDIPKHGCLNLHGSLLPAYRGRCPLNWVLVKGEQETGVTLHHMVEQPDAGDIVGQKSFPIEENDTAHDLHGKAVKAASELLDEFLPQIKEQKAPRIAQDHAQATTFPGRKPADGEIDWNESAETIRNLIRAVTRPYPGAFTHRGTRKILVWSAKVHADHSGKKPGTILGTAPFLVATGQGTLEIVSGQTENGVFVSGEQLARELRLVEEMQLTRHAGRLAEAARKKRVLILGIDGFIGNALAERLLDEGQYEVHGMDLQCRYAERLLGRPDFYFHEGDISIHREWIEYHVKKCDIILPLVAIATPIEYTRNPLRVFELDFEENLRIVRYCAKYGRRVLFPSTSEVYGMSTDEEFDEDNSRLVLGPIRKQRWIYSCSKQMLDRVIWAYGTTRGLDFTIFRPFNWIGPRLDSLASARIGSSRAITQLILNLVEGTPIQLVDGGAQKRCFTDVVDGVECLYRIIENKDGKCNGQIINIGNPYNEASIKELAELLVDRFENHPLRSHFPPFAGYKVVESRSYYGKGYEDVQHRRPSIKNAKRLVDWQPGIPLVQSVEKTLDYFLQQAIRADKDD